MTDTDLVTLLARYAPPWLKLVISALMTAWTLATAITRALRRVPEAQFVAFEMAWPRLGHVARGLRKISADEGAAREFALALGPETPPPATPVGKRVTLAPADPLGPRGGPSPISAPPPPPSSPGFARAAALVMLAVACALAIVLPLAASLAGCAGAQRPRPWFESAQIAIVASAHAVDAADAVVAARYTQRAADAGSLDALDARFARAVAARRTARETLLGAEVAVAAGRALDSAPARCRASLVLDAAGAELAHLGAALVAADADPPADMAPALALVIDAARALAPSCGDADAGR